METVPPPARLAKDFLSILDLSHADLERLLALAAEVKAHRHLGLRAPTAAALAGRHIGLLFEKPSLRTKTTFEVAVRELGGDALDLPAEFAGGSREPLEDVARNLERWVHGLVVRTYAQEKVETFARSATLMPVINALTDDHHPLQALADVMTMRERWGRAPRPLHAAGWSLRWRGRRPAALSSKAPAGSNGMFGVGGSPRRVRRVRDAATGSAGRSG